MPPHSAWFVGLLRPGLDSQANLELVEVLLSQLPKCEPPCLAFLVIDGETVTQKEDSILTQPQEWETGHALGPRAALS